MKYAKLGGEEYPVLYDINAAVIFEEITGKGLLEVMTSQSELRKMGNIRALVFAGISNAYEEHPPKDKDGIEKQSSLTLRKIGSALTFNSFDEATEFINLLMDTMKLPDGETVDEKNQEGSSDNT